MPSAKHKAATRRTQASSSRGSVSQRQFISRHIAFLPLVFLVLLMWVMYRILFVFPIWFDESIGKAVFFGLPVWLYLSLTRSKSMADTFAAHRIKPGLLLGIAMGGVFGFAGIIATLVSRNVIIQAAPVFIQDAFWGEFLLAMLTGFWESLFFFTWIMTVVQEKYLKWSLVNQVLLVAFMFLIFHLPNVFIKWPMSLWAIQIALLFSFAIGQALLFSKARNMYTLVLSHAIWAMVLLIHTR